MYKEGEQLVLFDLDSWHGKTCQEPSAQAPRRGKTSGSSSRRSAKLYAIPYMFLDLTPGHGNLLGESYWEIRSPWLGGSWTLNTGVLPREERVSSLSLILEDSPPRKYYLSRKACLGILRRARERGKPLPPQLETALKAQAGLTVHLAPVQDTPQSTVTAFAANQRDEIRDLHDVAGALGAQPGMKQQTFVAGIVSKGNGDCFLTPERHTSLSGGGGQAGQGYPCILDAGCLNPWDTQQARITAPEGVSPTINSGEAKPGGLVFAAGFCGGTGSSARSIGYQEEVAPTLKAGTSSTVLCLNDQGGRIMECSEDVTGTLRAQEHGHQPLVCENHDVNTHRACLCLNDQGGSRMDTSVDLTGTLRAQMDGHPPCIVEPVCAVFENHGIDARYTGPHDVVPTISARSGTGGNNLHLVEMFSRQRVDVFQKNDVASTESARQHKDATDLIYQETMETLPSGDAKDPNVQYASWDEPAAEGPLLIRRLTPRECERLQGFPDDWTNLPGAADAPRYKALGNSVAIPCVEYLMRGIACVLRAEAQRAG